MRLAESFRNGLAAAAEKYKANLTDFSPAAAYLQSRGIDRRAAGRYSLGVVDGSIPEHEHYEGMLCIPYVTRLGGVVSLKFRQPHACTDECRHAKYISPYPSRMFNTLALDEADETGYVFITEGEIDAIHLHSAGFPSVAVPGADSWAAHPEWAAVLAGYPRIFFPHDRDDAGRRCFEHVRGSFPPGTVADPGLPRGNGGRGRGEPGDIGEAFQQCGRDAFTEFYRRAVERG